MDNGSLARLYWRVLDALDYCLTQARLWAAHVMYGPEPVTAVDQRERNPRELD